MGMSEYMLLMGLLCVVPVVVLMGVVWWWLLKARRDTDRLDSARVRRS